MIYELSLVAKSELTDEQISKVQEMVHEVVKAHDGDILIQDDWGRLEFAQRTEDGAQTGRFLYFIYRTDNKLNNLEIERRIRINEGLLRHLIVRLGLSREQDKIVKAYKTPYSKTYNGSVLDAIEEKNGGEADKSKRHLLDERTAGSQLTKLLQTGKIQSLMTGSLTNLEKSLRVVSRVFQEDIR